MTPEGAVKREIKKILDAMGLRRAGGPEVVDPSIGWYYMPVNNGMGVTGIPDFMGLFYGHGFGIEAKSADGTPTANQVDRMQEMRDAHGLVFLIDPSNVSMLSRMMMEAVTNG